MGKRIVLGTVAILFVIAAAYASFYVAPEERTMGVLQRIFYFHVASAWAGMDAFLDLRGQRDLNGRELHHTVMAQADALAAAAGLLMGKGDGIPAVLIRGYRFRPTEGNARALIRAREFDLFR